MKLRDYQIDIVQQVYEAWSDGKTNVLPQLSTGAGKTVLMGKILSDYSGHSIAIAHRVELVSQISLTLARFGIRHNIIGQKQTIKDIISIHHMRLQKSFYDPHAKCTVAAVDTLLRRDTTALTHAQIGLLVIDEAHHVLRDNKWGKAAALFPNAHGLFLTATPVRADGNGLGRGADGIIDELIRGPGMRELITSGYLTDYRIFAPPSDLDLTPVPLSASGDFSPVKLRGAVHKSHITGDVVSHYLKIAPGKLGVTFAVDIRAATEIAAEFRANGIPAEVITSKTPDVLRYQIMQRFERRDILQIVNVDILGEGVDVPAIEVVSMARPTQSYSLFAQQFGRSLRPAPGKEHAIIIDHVNNCMRHGLPDAPRTWSLERKERRARSMPDDVIPLKTCLKCLSVYEKIYKNCPFCGFYSPPAVRSSPEFVDGDLLELDADALSRLRGEINRIDGEAKVPGHVEPYVKIAITKRHLERQQGQKELRDSIALWAGYLKKPHVGDSEIYKKFFFNFGIDIMTAQTLSTKDAEILNEKIKNHIVLLDNN